MILGVELWVQEMVRDLKPEAPVLEVGSLDINGSVRKFFPEPYTGMDMREGPGVDLVRNLLTDPPLPAIYNTIVCCEVLEHVEDPLKALEQMHKMLAPGGLILVTTPFAWPEHNEPNDYWRFTPQGLALLLERAGFDDVQTEWGNNRSHAFGHGRAGVPSNLREHEAVLA